MQNIQNTIVGTLEGVKDHLEQKDQSLLERQKIFAEKQEELKEEKKKEGESDLDKFKKVSLELMDIGVYYGQQGVDQIKHLPLYQKIDSVLNLDDKFHLVKEQGF